MSPFAVLFNASKLCRGLCLPQAALYSPIILVRASSAVSLMDDPASESFVIVVTHRGSSRASLIFFGGGLSCVPPAVTHSRQLVLGNDSIYRWYSDDISLYVATGSLKDFNNGADVLSNLDLRFFPIDAAEMSMYLVCDENTGTRAHSRALIIPEMMMAWLQGYNKI